MDMKLSCLIKGAIAIIFGLLALLLPGPVGTTFIGLFWIFIVLGVIVFLFLATTSRADESMFWFGLSAVFVMVGVISVLIQAIVTNIFLLIVAGIAFYSGFSDVLFALEHPKTKYVLISGMFLVTVLIFGVLIRYYPTTLDPTIIGWSQIILTILGVFAIVFGMFSILIGVYPAPDQLPPEQAGPTWRSPPQTPPPDDPASDSPDPPSGCGVCEQDDNE